VRHRIVPNNWFLRRGKQQVSAWHEDVGDSSYQLPLIFGRKQEHEHPCEDPIERSTKKWRILDGFASHRDAWKIASECLDESWGCINAKDGQPFGDQNLSDGETGSAAQIKNSGPAWERSSPLSHKTHADARKTATATAGQKLRCDTFISI